MVLEAYGPAAVLINRKLECLYYHGPVDRYLKVVSGRPVNDVIAMAREGVRAKLRSAVQRALHENARVVIPGGRTKGEAGASSFSIVVMPAPREREDLLLVCFVEEPEPQVAGGSIAPADVPRVVELERELEATKSELQNTIRNLELSSEEQMAVNEEALSVNEEYQVDERGAARLQGGTSIAQRGADRTQQPVAGNARAAADDRGRSAERPLQHQSRNDFPRHALQHPVLHTCDESALQCDSERCGPPAHGSQVARRRRRPLGRRPNGLQEFRRPSSGKSRGRAITGSCAGSCPTAPATIRSKAWLSLMKT